MFEIKKEEIRKRDYDDGPTLKKEPKLKKTQALTTIPRTLFSEKYKIIFCPAMHLFYALFIIIVTHKVSIITELHIIINK